MSGRLASRRLLSKERSRRRIAHVRLTASHTGGAGPRPPACPGAQFRTCRRVRKWRLPADPGKRCGEAAGVRRQTEAGSECSGEAVQTRRERAGRRTAGKRFGVTCTRQSRASPRAGPNTESQCAHELLSCEVRGQRVSSGSSA